MVVQPVLGVLTDGAMEKANSQMQAILDVVEANPLKRAMLEWFYAFYVPEDANRTQPALSPYHAADLTGLPSATVINAQIDPLRDDGMKYANKLAAANVTFTGLDIADLGRLSLRQPTGGANERPPKSPWGREPAATKEFGPSRGRARHPGAALARSGKGALWGKPQVCPVRMGSRVAAASGAGKGLSPERTEAPQLRSRRRRDLAFLMA